MPIVDYSVLEPQNCPHMPAHEVWVSKDNGRHAVCQMTDSHIHNCVRILERYLDALLEDELTGYTQTEPDHWLDVFDRELSRRLRLRVKGVLRKMP